MGSFYGKRSEVLMIKLVRLRIMNLGVSSSKPKEGKLLISQKHLFEKKCSNIIILNKFLGSLTIYLYVLETVSIRMLSLSPFKNQLNLECVMQHFTTTGYDNE